MGTGVDAWSGPMGPSLALKEREERGKPRGVMMSTPSDTLLRPPVYCISHACGRRAVLDSAHHGTTSSGMPPSVEITDRSSLPATAHARCVPPWWSPCRLTSCTPQACLRLSRGPALRSHRRALTACHTASTVTHDKNDARFRQHGDDRAALRGGVQAGVWYLSCAPDSGRWSAHDSRSPNATRQCWPRRESRCP